MKKLIVLLVAAFAIAGSAALSASSPQPETLPRLRNGEIVTDGGNLKRGAWATMEGVVNAPPKAVWLLFIRANDWKSYKLIDLIDSRAVDEAVLSEAKGKKKADDVYKILGDRVIDPLTPRVASGEWTNHTFQYFDMPWPVADRWYIIQNFADETRSKENVFRTRWESRAGNLRSLKGELILEPFEGDTSKTLLRYRAEVDLGSAIPRFMLRYGIKKSLPNAMTVIRREAPKLKDAALKANF